MSKKSKQNGQKILAVRLPDDLREYIQKVAAASGLAESDVARLALERGVPSIERMFAEQKDAAA